MVTVTRSVTVNAPFLREIKQDNQELRRLLGEADELFTTPPPSAEADLRRMAELLEALCDQFALHFALEEAFGYFEDPVDAPPEVSREVEMLVLQHADLYRAACELVERALRLRYHECRRSATRELALRYRDFHQRFRAHETREATLMLQGLADDTGVGD